jgi:hypothetical protein
VLLLRDDVRDGALERPSQLRLLGQRVALRERIRRDAVAVRRRVAEVARALVLEPEQQSSARATSPS